MSQPTAYLGLDPGKAGGIAVIYPDGQAFAWPMPETEKDLSDMMQELVRCGDFQYTAAIEQVWAHPGQGVCSMFTFGMGYGGLRMAVIAAGIPMQTVPPATWQKELNCRTKGDKMVAVKRAQELFPNLAWPKTKCGKLAIADALLLAEWLRRQSRA